MKKRRKCDHRYLVSQQNLESFSVDSDYDINAVVAGENMNGTHYKEAEHKFLQGLEQEDKRNAATSWANILKQNHYSVFKGNVYFSSGMAKEGATLSQCAN
ncbi:hypothetical protein PR048_013411 [Dryococelus australis]|uniref:Uncharacterized protein n=1 Tax=Dryococelus australis TaxID=614101 RepID=A0ABQ9HSY6_9NEOP|nr:hypothetical protein PR048_013411 [Dryococelus australis]